MSRDAGFARADVDTGLYADPKIVALARRLRDPVATAAHVALYEALVLASWGAGDRLTLEQTLPAWWLVEPDVDVAYRTVLEAVGLVDAEGRIPEHAWASWFTPASDRRRAYIERGRKGGRAPHAPRSPGATQHDDAWGEAQVQPESSTSRARANQPTVPTVPADPTIPVIPRAGARGDNGVDRV